MYYDKVFKALNKARVKYVVVGGTAVVLHGYRRFTDDLDLIVFLEESNISRCFDAITAAGYMPKVPVTKEQFQDKKQRERWKKEKGMIVFSFVERKPPFKLIDIFVDEPLPFAEVYKDRVLARVEGVTISLISIKHLLKLKKAASRDIDLFDIVQLEAIQEKLNASKKSKQ